MSQDVTQGIIYWFSRLDNEDDKYFHYATTVALNHEQIKRDPPRMSKEINIIGMEYNIHQK